VLREDGTLLPVTHVELARPSGEDAAAKAIEYVRRHWKYEAPPPVDPREEAGLSEEDLFSRARTHSLCISGMAFQDAWNIDLERLKRCCVHVISRDLRLVPFCAWYLTGSSGRRLRDLIP
jgi:7,8-dihydro-6-hydroxymethylpterin dimethyltransferase